MIEESRSVRIKTGTILSKNDLISIVKIATKNMNKEIDVFKIIITLKGNIILKSNSLDIFEDNLLYQNKIEEFELRADDMTTSVYTTIGKYKNFNLIHIKSYEQDKAKSIYLQYKELINSFDKRFILLKKPFFNIMYSILFFAIFLFANKMKFEYVYTLPTILIFITSFPSMKMFLPEIKFNTCKNNERLTSTLSWILSVIIIPLIFLFVGIYIQKYWNIS